MASSKAYLDFILDQLSGLDEISCRAMMGEYIALLPWKDYPAALDKIFFKANPF